MGERFQVFTNYLNELGIENQVVPILLENGFDDWEQTCEINEQILEEIGFQDPGIVQQIMACIAGATQFEFEEEQQQQEEEESEKGLQQQEEVKQEIPPLDKKQVYRKMQTIDAVVQKEITIQDIIKATSRKKEKNESIEKFLAGISVLSLNDKKFTVMNNINLCVNLKMAHLFSNLFTKIENLGQLQKLHTLHLESNNIRKIEGLESLSQLERLYLNRNQILVVEGLESLVNLKELQLSQQNIGQQELIFEPSSLEAIGQTLEQIECDGNNMTQLSNFKLLGALTSLKMRNNKFQSFEHFLEPLQNMSCLVEINLKGSPICKIQKYRDRFVLMSRTLEQLDEKKILPKERQFIMQLWKKKHGMMEKEEKKVEEKDKTQKQQLQDNIVGKSIKRDSESELRLTLDGQYQKLNSASDFHTNVHTQSTKHIPNLNNIQQIVMAELQLKLESSISEQVDKKQHPQLSSSQHIKIERSPKKATSVFITTQNNLTRNVERYQQVVDSFKEVTTECNKLFTEQQQRQFQKLQNSFTELISSFDERVVTALRKKEYELIKAFKTTMIQVSNELKQAQDKNQHLNIQIQLDSQIKTLEDHLQFFRCECEQLARSNRECLNEIGILNRECKVLKEEKECINKALTNVQTKFSTLQQEYKRLMDEHLQKSSKQMGQSQLMHRRTVSQNQNKRVGVGNMDTFNENSQIDVTSQNLNNTYVNNNNNLLMQSMNNPTTEQDEAEDSDKDSTIRHIVERNVRQESVKWCKTYMGKMFGNIKNEEISNIIDEILKNGINKKDTSFILLDKFLIEKFQDRDNHIYQLKERLRISGQRERRQVAILYQLQLKKGDQMNRENNLLKEFFLSCINETRAEIIKKKSSFEITQAMENCSLNNFNKSDKILVMAKFLTSKKFMELVQMKLFNEKCCNNLNCKYNLIQHKYNDVEESLQKDKFDNQQSDNIYMKTEEGQHEDSYHLQDNSSLQLVDWQIDNQDEEVKGSTPKIKKRAQTSTKMDVNQQEKLQQKFQIILQNKEDFIKSTIKNNNKNLLKQFLEQNQTSKSISKKFNESNNNLSLSQPNGHSDKSKNQSQNNQQNMQKNQNQSCLLADPDKFIDNMQFQQQQQQFADNNLKGNHIEKKMISTFYLEKDYDNRKIEPKIANLLNELVLNQNINLKSQEEIKVYPKYSNNKILYRQKKLYYPGKKDK